MKHENKHEKNMEKLHDENQNKVVKTYGSHADAEKDQQKQTEKLKNDFSKAEQAEQKACEIGGKHPDPSWVEIRNQERSK